MEAKKPPPPASKVAHESAPSQPVQQGPAYGTANQEPQVLSALSVGTLKKLARYHGVNLSGCLEKSEIIQAMRKAGIPDKGEPKEE